MLGYRRSGLGWICFACRVLTRSQGEVYGFSESSGIFSVYRALKEMKDRLRCRRKRRHIRAVRLSPCISMDLSDWLSTCLITHALYPTNTYLYIFNCIPKGALLRCQSFGVELKVGQELLGGDGPLLRCDHRQFSARELLVRRKVYATVTGRFAPQEHSGRSGGSKIANSGHCRVNGRMWRAPRSPEKPKNMGAVGFLRLRAPGGPT